MHQKFCSTTETFSKILKSQQKILSSSSHQKLMFIESLTNTMHPICYLAYSDATYLWFRLQWDMSTLEGKFDLCKSLEILISETTAVASYLCGSYYVFYVCCKWQFSIHNWYSSFTKSLWRINDRNDTQNTKRKCWCSNTMDG